MNSGSELCLSEAERRRSWEKMGVWGRILLTCDNVLLNGGQLESTPSCADGMEAEMEWETRVVGCELISSAGILLKLPQTAMATGQVLFHRFFYSKSFLRLEMEHTAMACIYLASKIEEAPRRIRDVINVFHHLHQLRSGKPIEPMVLDQTYIQLKGDVTLAERRVLKELGFCVHVKHPHKLIVVYLQQLGYDRDSQFVQMSWNFMSDSLRTNAWVRYRIEAIACACIFLSARKLKIPLPNSPAWYVVFDVEEAQILDICETILFLYEKPRIDYDDFSKKYKALRQAFKESKEKSKRSLLGAAPTTIDSATNSPSSTAPTSPKQEKEGSAVESRSVVKNDDQREEDLRRNGSDSAKPRRTGTEAEHRRSPSPSHERRQKTKRRRRSRSSSSRSRSRERRVPKKSSHRRSSRSRSNSPDRRSHRKKSSKSHRYRSRSRSRSPYSKQSSSSKLGKQRERR